MGVKKVILTPRGGQGGQKKCDFARFLGRGGQKWLESKKFKKKIVDLEKLEKAKWSYFFVSG